ncbi:MAG: hypothetical protein R2873_04545 [Caldilineaceae bacterium]
MKSEWQSQRIEDPQTPVWTTSVAWVDVDSDGDLISLLEIDSSGGKPNEIYLNPGPVQGELRLQPTSRASGFAIANAD